MKKILITIFIYLYTTIAICNEDTSIWVSNTYQTDFNKSNYVGFLELQPRINNNTDKFSQLIIRPFIGYKLNKEFTISLGYAWQGEYNSKDKFDLATDDIIEQLQYNTNLSDSFNFQYRFRLEQRFFENENLAHRMRHRFRLQYIIPESNFYIVSFDELFIYFNSINSGRLEHSVQSGINQNRSYLGVGYKVNSNISLDTGYQLQYVNNFGKEDLFNHVWLTNIAINF